MQTEKWSKICQSASKPYMELAELNTRYLNKLGEQARTLQEATHSRRPEELMSATINSLTGSFALTADHWRKVTDVVLEGFSETGKLCTDTLQEAMSQASGGLGGWYGATTSGKTRGESSSREK